MAESSRRSQSGPSRARGHEFRDLTLNDGVRAHLGDVYNQTHLPAPRQETPPLPFSNVPFPRDADFVYRDEISKLDEKLSGSAARVALVGLGGVGKSQLAIEYTYHLRQRVPDTWTFWLHASNPARFEQGVRNAVAQLKIPERHDPNASVFQLLRNWLWDERKGKWLIVLDNADDPEFLLQKVAAGSRPQNSFGEELYKCFPVCSHGSLLITSRSKKAALKLVEDRDIVDVHPMDEALAVKLLQTKLDTNILRGDDEAAKLKKLAAALEYMPLALSQAAAYIRRKSPRCSITQYLDRMSDTENSKNSLLSYDGGDLRRDAEAKNSIFTTWQISFDYLYKDQPSAAHLLSIMSFFDRQAIPQDILAKAYRKYFKRSSNKQEPVKRHSRSSSKLFKLFRRKKSSKDSGHEARPAPPPNLDDMFHNDIEVLMAYSFIATNNDNNSFDMHRLVQIACQKWIGERGQPEPLKSAFIDSLWSKVPDDIYENLEMFQKLFPHIISAMAQRPVEDESVERWGIMLTDAAWFALDQRQLEIAEELSLMAHSALEATIGPYHYETSVAMEALFETYTQQGRLEEVEQLCLSNLAKLKNSGGSKDANAIRIMNGLANIYQQQDRLKEASELQSRTIELCETTLDKNHELTLIGMGTLGLIHGDRGLLQEAERVERDVLQRRQEKDGENHPFTLIAMSNLANNLHRQGKTQSGVEMMKDCVSRSSKVLGETHIDTKRRYRMLAKMENRAKEKD